MKQTHLLTTVCALLAGVGLTVSCAKEYKVNDTAINTGVKMEVEDVTAIGAKLSLNPTQEVASYILAGPVLASTYAYSTNDAVHNLAWIQENGVEKAYPYEDEKVTGLNAGADYICGFVAKDAKGVICSAPRFEKFTTGTAKPLTTVSLPTPGVFTFEYSIIFNSNAKSIKWIVSTDNAVTSLDSDALKAYVLKNGKTSTTTVDGTISSATKADCVVAAVAFDALDREGEFHSSLCSTETLVKVVVAGGATTSLKRTTAGVDIFSGAIDFPASSSFTVSINSVDYGFTSYSGNGGVGTVNNMNAAMPFYNLTSEMTYKFYVEKALGQMTTIAEGGNAFWTNFDAATRVNVTIDMTNQDGIYRYRFEVPQTDESIIFYEGFDLSVWGGQFQAPVMGTVAASGSITTWDGTEPGKKDGASTSGMGIDNFCYPDTVTLSGKEVYLSETLIKNWGLQDWTFKKGYLSAGHMRIAASATSCFSYVYTPKFSKLTSPTDLTFTTECWSFAADFDQGLFHFDVDGAGKFGKVTVTNTAGYNQTFTVNNTQFTPTAIMIPAAASNSVVNKTIAKFVFTIEGATADTRLRFGTDPIILANLKHARLCVDYVKVTK